VSACIGLYPDRHIVPEQMVAAGPGEEDSDCALHANAGGPSGGVIESCARNHSSSPSTKRILKINSGTTNISKYMYRCSKSVCSRAKQHVSMNLIMGEDTPAPVTNRELASTLFFLLTLLLLILSLRLADCLLTLE
jgi:hypothetical protein